MPTPPTPFTPAVLLAAAAKLGFRPVTRNPAGLELGTFVEANVDHHLLIAGAASLGTVAWRIVDTVPAGFGPFFLARETYDVLHGGTLNPDGSVSFQGRSYWIQANFDGAYWTACAVSVTIAA